MDYLIEKYGLEAGASGVALEDCIMQKGVAAGAGSGILRGFVSPFDAAVVERLKDRGIPIACRASMDEFGLDPLIFGEDEKGPVPGAVGAVAAGEAAAALSNDVFGKLRRAAPELGLGYIRPTYGTVSRFGLIPAVCSMDQIGVVCKTPSGGFEILSAVAGADERDGAMLPRGEYCFAPRGGEIRLAFPEKIWASARAEDKRAREALEKSFRTAGMELLYFEVYGQVLCALACAELSNNANRYDGIKFGHRAGKYGGLKELYLNTRSEALGREAKLASIFGALVLSRDYYEPYYEKAMKIRRLIRGSLRFDSYDVLVLPSRLEGGARESVPLYAAAALTGLPCVSFPLCGGGIQLLAAAGCENTLYGVWEALI